MPSDWCGFIAKIFITFSSIGSISNKSGDVTLRVASSKYMAMYKLYSAIGHAAISTGT